MRSERDQLEQIRRAQEAAKRARKQAADDILFTQAMRELNKIEGSEGLGPEIKTALANWKAGLS